MPFHSIILGFLAHPWHGRRRRSAANRRSPRRRRGYTKPRLERLESRLLMHGGQLADAEGEDAPEPMPDFTLVDVNPNSSTYQHNVSPRDYTKQVSGWYFTYAT